jgi:hypothetical protein
LYLGSRGEGTDDFDGGGLREVTRWWVERDAFVAEITPAIQYDELAVKRVILHGRHVGGHLPPPPGRLVSVHVVPYISDDDWARTSSVWWGEIADDPGLFGPTRAQTYDEWVAEARSFIERAGGLDWARLPTRDAQFMERFVKNMGSLRRDGVLNKDLERRLEAIPGWAWLDWSSDEGSERS